MGINRYPSSFTRAWEQRFDQLQLECHVGFGDITIGELLDHGIEKFKWRCRSIGWKDDGKGECWHSSDMRLLSRYGRFMKVWDIRCRNMCGQCGRKRPFMELWAD